MTPAAREALIQAAADAGHGLRKRRDAQDKAAIDAMKRRGLNVHTLTPDQVHEWREFAESVYPRIRGEKVPAEIFDQVRLLISQYRSGNNEPPQ